MVRADVLHEQERPTLRCGDGAARTREPVLSARAVGIDLFAALRATRIRKAFIVIAWRTSPAIC
jgi:hypothetical protein